MNSNQHSTRALDNLLIAKRHKMLWSVAIIVLLLMTLVNRAEASFKTVVGGITVSYSGAGSAYFDSTDGTLTIEINSSGGNLLVSVGSTANASWGNYVDVYILADNATLNSINIKGSTTCTPYICGEVWYVSKFTLSNGVVGDTLYYGWDFGLGMGANTIPSSISLKNSYATAQLFGYPNQ
jgi:hypothetical protein